MEKTLASGENQSSSGVTETQDNQIIDVKEDKVSYSTHHKLLGEAKKAKEEARELREFKARVEAEKKLAEEKELEAKGEYQKLLQEKEKELENARLELSSTKEMIANARKMSALNKALSGKLNEKYYGIIDLGKIELDESGQPLQSSVERYAKDVSKTYPEIIIYNNGARLPMDGARGAEKSLSYDEWLKLPAKEMRARYKDIKSNTRRD